MWMARSSFICPTMAANVDDFPEPVGPVISTSPFRRWNDFLDYLRQAKTIERGNCLGDRAHHHGTRAALAEHVHAKAPDAGNSAGKVGRSGLIQMLQAVLAVANQIARNPDGVVGAEAIQPVECQLNQFAIYFNLRQAPWRKNQIADLRMGFRSSP